jgi:PAS domain S-box-containing protein
VVVEVGEEQIVAGLGRRAIPVAAVAGSLILAVGVGIFLLWGWQRRRHQAAERSARQEKEALSSHYNALSRSAHDAILLVDAARRVVEANERATEMFGYTHAQWIGMDVALIRAEPALNDFEAQWEQTDANAAFAFVAPFRRADGSVFPCESTVQLLVVGGQRYHQAVIRDVTQREQERRALENANRLYAVLSRCNQAIVRASSANEVFEAVTRSAAEEGGFRLATLLLAEPATQRLVPVAAAGPAREYAKGLEVSAASAPAGQGPGGLAFRLAHSVVVDVIDRDERMEPWRERAAQWRLASEVAAPVLRNGKSVGVLALYSEEAGFFNQREVELIEEIAATVSFAMDRLDAEERRSAADERYRVLVENAPLGMYVHRDFRILYANQPFVELLGARSAAQLVGLDIHRIIHPDDHPVVERRVQRSASGEPAPLLEERFVKLDGTIFPVEVSTVPIEFEAQKAILVFCVDITQRKQAEAERAALQEQFLQAQKMETVGRLAGGVAHDFNNHLTVINGYCDLLLGELGADARGREEIAVIRKAGDQAAKLTRQLLTFSRKQVTEPRLVNLNDMVAEAEALLGRLIGDHIRIQTRLAPGLDVVAVDPTQIQQVLMNLAINARDAMPAGGQLMIETGNFVATESHAGPPLVNEKEHWVRLTVSDTGIGMDEQTRRLAFEPFFTTKARGLGTGLGLATVYAVVSQAGGSIELRSVPGEGTTFDIYLPRAEPGSAATPEPLAAPRSTAGKETILLVEDQREVRRLTATILRALGYYVLEAEGGEKALQLVEEAHGPIDLLLTDVMMPGLTGPQLAVRLRAARPALKVLFISGYSADITLVAGAAEETVHRLSKPFSPAALAQKVREVIDG